MSQVVIIDYGAGNIDSVFKAVKNLGADVAVSSESKALEMCSHIILPGVGSFDVAYKGLEATGLIPVIKEQVKKYNIPLLGICVGMQLLSSYGDEGDGSIGLDLIPGRVSLIDNTGKFKLPHVGWNDISHDGSNSLFENIPNNKDFYFVHSYSFVTDIEKHTIAKVDYAGDITAAVSKGNIYGVQFHPEKSQRIGAILLQNFLNL